MPGGVPIPGTIGGPSLEAMQSALVTQVLLFAQEELQGGSRKNLSKIRDAFKDDEGDAKNRQFMMSPPKIEF